MRGDHALWSRLAGIYGDDITPAIYHGLRLGRIATPRNINLP